MKNHKLKNVADVDPKDKKLFDKGMNSRWVVIEHAFVALKGRKKILKR
jgi:hypothetical protein